MFKKIIARAWRIVYEGALYHVLSRVMKTCRNRPKKSNEFGRSAPRNIYRHRKVREKDKQRYLPDTHHAELPSQKRVVKDVNLNTVLSRAAGILKCGLNLRRKSARISQSAKTDRDLLIYIAWQLGVATNQQIGEKFGLTYSAVSLCVKILKEKLKKDRDLNEKQVKIKSLIKI